MHEGKPHKKVSAAAAAAAGAGAGARGGKTDISKQVQNLATHKKQEDQKKKVQETTYTGPTENVMAAETTAVKFKSPPVEHTLPTKGDSKPANYSTGYADLGIKPKVLTQEESERDSVQRGIDQRNRNVGGIQMVSAPHEYLMSGGPVKNVIGKIASSTLQNYPW